MNGHSNESDQSLLLRRGGVRAKGSIGREILGNKSRAHFEALGRQAHAPVWSGGSV